MKIKLKKAICIVCSIILMITAFVVPISASAEITPLYTLDGYNLYNPEDIGVLYYEGKYATNQQLIDAIEKYSGVNLNDGYYFITVGHSGSTSICATVAYYEKSTLSDGVIEITKIGNNKYKTSVEPTYFKASAYQIDKNNSVFNYVNYNSEYSEFNLFFAADENNKSIGFLSNCFVQLGDEKVGDGQEPPPVPFTVTYTPELSDDMKNVVYIPSKGGANADENGNVEQQLHSFKLTVTLTDEYIALLNKYPDLNKHTYEFIVYITTEPPETVGYSQSANKAVYTDVHYGYYMYTTSGVVADVTDDYNEPTNWIKAQGVNIGYIIPKGQKSKTVDINLQNVDTSKLEKNQHLYCVVYGRQTLLDYPTPDYFNVANQESLCKGELNSTITYVIEDDDNDPNNNIEVVAPDYYCATSEPFYFSEYPEYSPKHFENGEIYDTNKGVFAYTDKKIAPDKMWDFDMASKGDNGLTPDEFKVYEDNKKLSENYQSFKFDTTDLSSIFTEGTDFFRFLTTSISILPSYFMTILISFFTIFLAIVLIKFVF